jgi:hypothetical protein
MINNDYDQQPGIDRITRITPTIERRCPKLGHDRRVIMRACDRARVPRTGRLLACRLGPSLAARISR